MKSGPACGVKFARFPMIFQANETARLRFSRIASSPRRQERPGERTFRLKRVSFGPRAPDLPPPVRIRTDERRCAIGFFLQTLNLVVQQSISHCIWASRPESTNVWPRSSCSLATSAQTKTCDVDGANVPGMRLLTSVAFFHSVSAVLRSASARCSQT